MREKARDTGCIVITGLTAERLGSGAVKWTPPAKPRVRAIRDRLREMYGRPIADPHRAPVDELIKTVLSQHTNDRNRDLALAPIARALPELGGGPRRAARAGRGGDPSRRPRPAEGAPHPGDPRCTGRSAEPRLDRDGGAGALASSSCSRFRASVAKPLPA